MPDKKKFLKHLSIAVFAFVTTICAASAAQIDWKDVNAGLQEGKYRHKYVLADIYTSWCGWCKRLDKDTFTNPELIQFLSEKFVSIRANAEDGEAGQKLANEYGVHGFPCGLVFNSDGKLIGRIDGYKDAEGYQRALQNIVDHPEQ